MIKDFFNPPSLVLKASAPIMPKAMLAGPSNAAALQYFCYYIYMSMDAAVAILQILFILQILIFQLLLQPFDTTLYVPYVFDVAAIAHA